MGESKCEVCDGFGNVEPAYADCAACNGTGTQKALPLPAELVERIERELGSEHSSYPWRLHADRVVSVVADYLRSDEVRERVRLAILHSSGHLATEKTLDHVVTTLVEKI